MIDLENKEIVFALGAVRRAARLAVEVQRELALDALAKSDLSPVTVADYAAQALTACALERAFPADPLIGEEDAAELRTESGAAMLASVMNYLGRFEPGVTEDAACDWIDAGAGTASGRFWTLDPVDGTKGFLRGGHYAAALALIEDGVVTVGALACPEMGSACGPETRGGGMIFIAARGQGTWGMPLNGEDAPLRRLTVSAETTPAKARVLRSVEAGHTDSARIDAIAAHLGISVAPVGMDSQAKYGVLAAGGGELIFRLLSPKAPDYKEKIWDQAAGSLVLEEAGGKITDLSGKPLDFTQGRRLENNTGVFASNGWLHDAGLEAIAAV